MSKATILKEYVHEWKNVLSIKISHNMTKKGINPSVPSSKLNRWLLKAAHIYLSYILLFLYLLSAKFLKSLFWNMPYTWFSNSFCKWLSFYLLVTYLKELNGFLKSWSAYNISHTEFSVKQKHLQINPASITSADKSKIPASDDSQCRW